MFCTGHTGGADDNTKPAPVTTNDAATHRPKLPTRHDKDRCSIREQRNPAPGGDVAYARRLARALNALCDHYEALQPPV